MLVITAAVQSPEGAEPLLRTAFEEARVRGVPLVVLHAWWLGDVYDNLTRDPATRVDWEERTGREFEPVLTPLQERYPDVEVSLVVRNIPPAEAILDAADSSELLVIARRLGYEIESIPVEWTYGTSSKVNPVRDSLYNARDLLMIKWNDLRGRYKP